jgi:hypothetical protein
VNLQLRFGSENPGDGLKNLADSWRVSQNENNLSSLPAVLSRGESAATKERAGGLGKLFQ